MDLKPTIQMPVERSAHFRQLLENIKCNKINFWDFCWIYKIKILFKSLASRSSNVVSKWRLRLMENIRSQKFESTDFKQTKRLAKSPKLRKIQHNQMESISTCRMGQCDSSNSKVHEYWLLSESQNGFSINQHFFRCEKKFWRNFRAVFK